MVQSPKRPLASLPRTPATLAAVAAGVMASACSGGLGDKARTDLLAEAPPAAQGGAGTSAAPQSELEKATAYWGKEYAKSPRNLDAAIAYSKNLKALGQRGQALSVLQQASLYHAKDRRLNSEYGRLALELDQVSVAASLLEAADDPTAPDWRVISARGTVLAKQGRYKESIPYYERALTLAQDQPSVTSNLAMAYAMSGESGRAEELLRKAAAADPDNAKVRQNLAIVLGLQGKHEEAKSLGAGTEYADATAHNSDLMRKLVRLDAQPSSTKAKAIVQEASAQTTAKPVQASLKPAAAEKPAPVNAAAQLADAHAEPMFKPSAR